MKEKAVSLVVTAPYARRQRGTGDELRTKVIRVASEMMAELGDVDALTMRDIASAAGVTAPSVYRHFPNKHTLLRTVITERFDELSGELRAAAAAAGDALAATLTAVLVPDIAGPIVLSGSIVSRQPAVARRAVRSVLTAAEGVEVITVSDGLAGAAVLALRQVGVTVDDSILVRLHGSLPPPVADQA